MSQVSDDPTADPSMEDILSSIRRILNEDRTGADQGAPDGPEGASDGAAPELLLDQSMLAGAAPAPNRSPTEMQDAEPPDFSDVEMSSPLPALPADGLVGAPVARTVAGLFGRLAAERQALVGRAGVTIEDLVREELRPGLHAWLEQHLPPLVERLVREELARISGGSGA